MGVVAMHARGAGRRSLEPVGRWLLLLVALSGLFAMHGLSDHGVGTLSSTLSVSSTAGDDHSRMHADLVGEASSPAAGAAIRDLPADEHGNTGHGDGHGGSVVGACLAVLAALSVLALAAWGAGVLVRLRYVLLEASVVAAATAFWARARGPAPPDLRLLSIQRC